MQQQTLLGTSPWLTPIGELHAHPSASQKLTARSMGLPHPRQTGPSPPPGVVVGEEKDVSGVGEVRSEGEGIESVENWLMFIIAAAQATALLFVVLSGGTDS